MTTLQSEQRIKNLLRLVAQQNASDLHLVVGRYPTLRLDGKLYPLTQESILSADDTQALSDALMSEDNKKKLIADGQVDFSYNFEDKARFRTNIFHQQGNTSVTMRMVSGNVRTLEELNIPPILYDFTKNTQGLLLVTGPVGHGKSTTLSALIDFVNHNEDKHIITIEDPIEYIYEQDRCIINQREVGRDTKSFPDGLRSVFREDANVVLIGELRDLDTISTAMTAAETGHLILATLHTNDTSQTIDRIVDVFPAHQQNQIRSQLASVLLGVVSQRLVPKVGGGRIPAMEIMMNNHAVENLIRENKSYQIDSVIETSLREGMVSLDKSLADLIQRGLITMDDALIYSKNEEYLQMLISKK
ncbi:MAG: Pilus retraction protein PilT [Candidatus Moranbacteria bacterium GW2011_GWC2_37_73]|nr:MAG: Pilus retraction protein PilT [Parcubacteria group bacterium GW2011_GWC1_36_108]KKQ00773.1 MAG: Pilus retraction protein PilT [Candidatus Moranbacteria bacterium GW2011_GWD1_36_198]KKQ02234.1 MAG: Pilus retraction protein PilT [Candidatus Moranbacteria bacterium GW2011_GWD2_36_198]KKQ39699.1 MAG: Pilus retraction protein PilT [Candidatus Moranbacteria bacterium GW2011_GWC2_37_73]HAR99649.1 type IV pili twitching motility protein PilT [Candidatus Moranbacteria bacterium]